MGVSCERCGSEIPETDWYCSTCGKERPKCPDCGADMDDTACKNCGKPRQAPCDECGLMIEATASKCPNCGYNPGEEKRERYRSRFKKSLIGVVIGFVVYAMVASVVPGPSIIGTALGLLIGGPIVVMAGGMALNAKRKEGNADDVTAVNVRKGREENKSEAWREKERQQREEAARAAEKGFEALGTAAESWTGSDSS